MNRAAALPLTICSAVAALGFAASAGKTAMDAHQFADKANTLFVDGKPVEVQRDQTSAILAGLFGVVAIGSLVYGVMGEDALVQAVSVSPDGQPADPPIASTAPIVSTAPVQQYSTDVRSDRYAWVEDVLTHPFLLVWGTSGSGKSTAAEWVCYERLRRGHEVKIFDPHAKFGQWEGLELIGKGMQFEAIDRGLMDTIQQIEDRYRQLSNYANFNPRPVSVLCEEMTSWSFRCPDSAGEFFRTSLSDLRKVKYHAVFVAHDRTLEALGGGKGIAKARDNTLLELQLFSQLDPKGSGNLVPTGKGKLKYPSGKVVEVDIPEYFQNPTRPTVSTVGKVPPPPEIFSAPTENQENLTEHSSSASESEAETFTFPLESLGKPLYLAVKACLESGMGKSQIVQEVLECKGRKYTYGCAWFDTLMQKFEQEQ